MKMSKLHIMISTLAIALAAFSCSGNGKAAASNTGNDADSTAQATVVAPDFDADSAYAFVAMQTRAGVRTPGSAGHDRVGDMLSDALRAYGADTVIEQRATVSQVDGSTMPVRNIFGSFNSAATRRLLLLAHYDTRPWADADADPANHRKPIDGANDGASGVGVLLEIARHIGANAPAVGIDILFTDSEDSGIDAPEDADQATQRQYELSWCLGTQHFVRNLPYNAGNVPEAAILLDMVGARDAVFRYEYFSMQSAPQLMRRVWDNAAKAGYGARFINEMGGAVNDDHVHLIGFGIPAIDIIEIGHPATGSFNPTWHTLQDNLQNIDPATLKAVGQTVLSTIYNY